MPPPNPDRVCVLANNALEVLLDKQKHLERCPQCPIDPNFCNEAQQFDKQFRELFAVWRVHRTSGGVVLNAG